MSLLAVLFIVFLVLKLTHNIDWSWWVVFLPLAGELVVDFIVLTFGIAVTALVVRSDQKKLRQ